MQTQTIRKLVLVMALISLTLPALFGQEVSIESEDQDSVLYTGWDNRISVTINCKTSDSLFLTTNEGTIIQVSQKHFVYRTSQRGAVKFTLMLNQRNESEKLAEMTFLVKDLPDPVACVGKRTGGTFEREAFIAQIGVGTLQLQALKIRVLSQVTEYNFTIRRNNRILFTSKNAGPGFSESIKKSFAELLSGDTIVIDNIRIMKADGRVISAEPLEFLIK